MDKNNNNGNKLDKKNKNDRIDRNCDTEFGRDFDVDRTNRNDKKSEENRRDND